MTANKITMLRVALVPFFFACTLLYYGGCGIIWAALAFVVFALASATDKLDGYVAKKYDQISDFGKIMDPLADKLLVFAALSAFTAYGDMHYIALWLILARELAVTSMRVVRAGKGVIVAAEFSGKLKTAVQFAAIHAILALPLLAYVGLDFPAQYRCILTAVLSWLMAAVALISGADYFYKNRAALKKQE